MHAARAQPGLHAPATSTTKWFCPALTRFENTTAQLDLLAFDQLQGS
jgi:hypothetical protein